MEVEEGTKFFRKQNQTMPQKFRRKKREKAQKNRNLFNGD